VKSPKIKQPKVEEVTPFPDASGAATMQSKFDALKQALSRRGRSSTLLTYGNPASRSRSGGGSYALSGRLSDVDGARSAPTVIRGG